MDCLLILIFQAPGQAGGGGSRILGVSFGGSRIGKSKCEGPYSGLEQNLVLLREEVSPLPSRHSVLSSLSLCANIFYLYETVHVLDTYTFQLRLGADVDVLCENFGQCDHQFSGFAGEGSASLLPSRVDALSASM